MKKGGMFAALIIGKKKPKMGDEPDMPADAAGDPGEEDYGDLPPDFEDEAIKFMPELEGDSKRLMAFWKAIKACMEA